MSAPAVRSTWAWLAVLAIAVAAIVWQVTRPSAPADHDEHDAAVSLLIDLDAASWSAVELLGPNGMQRFERDGAGRWLLHGEAAGEAAGHQHRADTASADRIASVFGAFARARIERVLPVAAAGLTPYGLDRPEWIVLIHGAEKRPPLTLEVGQVAADGLSRYVRLPRDGRVVTVANFQIEGVLALLRAP
jgi:Domain of unknown function (DUF4340)